MLPPAPSPSGRSPPHRAEERSAWFWLRLFLWGAAIGGVLVLPKFSQRFQAMQRRAAVRDQQWRQQLESQGSPPPAAANRPPESGAWWLLAAAAAGLLLLGGFALLALRTSRPDKVPDASHGSTNPPHPAAQSASASSRSARAAARPPPDPPPQVAVSE